MQISFLWYAALLLGVIALICTWYRLFRGNSITDDILASSAVSLFAASWIMYIPEEYFNDIPASANGLKEFESLVTALLRALNIYSGNGYERVAVQGHPVFSGIYASTMALINISLILIVAGFILKFLDGPLQSFRIMAGRKRHVYIFSECSEKAQAIAETIPSGSGMIIFASTGKESPHKTYLDAVNAVHVPDRITKVIDKVSKSSEKTEVFLFSEAEEENLSLMGEIINYQDPAANGKIRTFVSISKTPWNMYRERITDYFDKTGNIINLVRAEENFVCNYLWKNSIFKLPEKVCREKKEPLDILMIGMNKRNLELLKTLLHLGQMPDYSLHITVLDQGSSRGVLKREMPEVYDSADAEGDAIYSISYIENADCKTDAFEKTITDQCPGFTHAFIETGDDMASSELAVRLYTLCSRRQKDDYTIHVSLRNLEIGENWNQDIRTRVRFSGSLKEVYSYPAITMSDIEAASEKIHYVRYPTGDRSWEAYCTNEYNRHSVYARTLSFKYKVMMIDKFYHSDFSVTQNDRRWKIYEHMRWNMYTRTQGYTAADGSLLQNGKLDRKTKDAARVHPDLVPYDLLPEKEQEKDGLELNEEIIKILRA